MDEARLDTYQQIDAIVADLFSVVPSGNFLMGCGDGRTKSNLLTVSMSVALRSGYFLFETDTIESS
jgi:hypothetical protein